MRVLLWGLSGAFAFFGIVFLGMGSDGGRVTAIEGIKFGGDIITLAVVCFAAAGGLFAIGALIRHDPMPSAKPSSIEAGTDGWRSQLFNPPAPAEFPKTKDMAIQHVIATLDGLRIFLSEDVEHFSDPFKIFLSDHYQIRRHEILGKFILGEKLYEDLEAALGAARDNYIEQTKSLRHIEASDWDRTRNAIETDTYVRTSEVLEVASVAYENRKITLWSDGAFQIFVDGRPNKFCKTLTEAQEVIRSARPSVGNKPSKARKVALFIGGICLLGVAVYLLPFVDRLVNGDPVYVCSDTPDNCSKMIANGTIKPITQSELKRILDDDWKKAQREQSEKNHEFVCSMKKLGIEKGDLRWYRENCE